jgi:hypothetical protein
VAAETPGADLASATGKVDLSDHALAEKPGRPLCDLADELMPRHSSKLHVAFEDLEIRGADAG